jgi:quercetin dioxygenase-like cupin family protein
MPNNSRSGGSKRGKVAVNEIAPKAAKRIVHRELPIITSPSRLPSQHIVTEAAGAEGIFVGQQWLEPGDRVLLHTHPVEEALTFMSGVGEARLGDSTVTIGPGVSLFIPPGVVHGFRNTGNEQMHVMIVFEGPRFAETIICEDQAPR